MSLKGTSTREKIIDRGLELLSMGGFRSLTLSGIAVRARMSKSGIFAHFQSHEELTLAIIQRMTSLWMSTAVVPASLAKDGLPRLRLYMTKWLDWPQTAGLPGGCVVASALFELDDAPGEIRDAIAASEEEWRLTLGLLIESSMRLGHLSTRLDSRRSIDELWGIYLVHHVVSRFRKVESAKSDALALFEDAIKRSRGRRFASVGAQHGPNVVSK